MADELPPDPDTERVATPRQGSMVVCAHCGRVIELVEGGWFHVGPTMRSARVRECPEPA